MHNNVFRELHSLYFYSGISRLLTLAFNQFTCKLNVAFSSSLGCQFYPVGEYLKFVRVPENLEIGTEILSLEAHPRNRLSITPVDKVRHHFSILILFI